jgi:broad specificity phosphatase PhoE
MHAHDAPPRRPEIVLVRHGRSAHAERGWLDADGVRRWMAAYDAAEIALHHPPPPALVALAREAGHVVASDLPRAAASARVIAPGVDVQTTALLREAPLETPELPLPRLGGVRLPVHGWGLVFGVRWLWASWRGAPPPGVDATALARADEAASWLTELAATHGRVVAVTHATFRSLVTASLRRQGWRGPERRPLREWSAWVHVRGAEAPPPAV